MTSLINPHTVFVYGTLKPNQGANYMFGETSDDLGEGTSAPVFSMRGGGFPAVFIEAEGGLPVRGQAYRVDDEVLSHLDNYEGYPGFYDRVKVPVTLDSGDVVSAWVYIIPEKNDFPGHDITPDQEGVLVWPPEDLDEMDPDEEEWY